MLQVGQFVNCLVEARNELQNKYVCRISLSIMQIQVKSSFSTVLSWLTDPKSLRGDSQLPRPYCLRQTDPPLTACVNRCRTSALKNVNNVFTYAISLSFGSLLLIDIQAGVRAKETRRGCFRL